MRTRERRQGAGSPRAEAGSRKPGPARWLALLAVAVAAGCAAPKAQITDAAWVSHSTTGRGAYERGDYRRAADAYARAQQRARALDDADALAVAAVNRAVCLLLIDRAPEARAAIDEALADGRVSVRRRSELQAWGARVSLALEQPDAALEQAAAALTLSPSPGTRAQAVLVQSAAHLARGETEEAAQSLASGLPGKGWRQQPAAVQAEWFLRRGQMAAAEGRPAEAAAHFDEAAARWNAAGRLPEMARALAETGRQLRAAGELREAGERLLRSARSLWAQGLANEAVRVLEEGVACAAEADDDVLGRRMADLVVTFQSGTRLINQTQGGE